MKEPIPTRPDYEGLDDLRRFWEEHRKRPFPPSLLSKSVNGRDLVLLDSGMAGCISTFLSRGSLDAWRACLLGMDYHDVAGIVTVLHRDGAVYFEWLRRMAGLTLRLAAEQASAEQEEA
jgi:hypothetical protein